MPEDNKAIPSKPPREITFTLEFYSRLNYQSYMKKEFSFFKQARSQKNITSNKLFRQLLKMQVFALAKKIK